MSDCFEFGFDESKIIKSTGVEVFKQNRPGETNRISVVSFKKIHDELLAKKSAEKGAPLTAEEKAELFTKIDERLAEKLKKPVEKLTEVDRLNINEWKCAGAFCHFGEGVGTIRCLSKYEGNTVVKPEECCNRFGEADQKVGTVIMTYPLDRDGQIDEDLLRMKKYTNFYVWVMPSKKFKKFKAAYEDARRDKRFIIDLRVTLDGDSKFQKQQIEAGSTALWAREDFDPEVRNWILDQGLRAWKYVNGNLGFKMELNKLMEKLSGVSSSSPSMSSGQPTESPKLIQSYSDLID